MRSQIWQAQDALYQALSNATWPGSVQVDLATPPNMERDSVWVSGEVDDWSAEYRTSGLAAKDENFVLRVHVLSKRLGNYTDARDRVKALGEVVEDAVGADHTLAGTVMLATIERSQLEDSLGEDGRTRMVLLTLWVRCRAHVTPAPPSP
jgi:hypothetical protein